MKIELTPDEQKKLADLMSAHAGAVSAIDVLEAEIEERQAALNDFVNEKINEAYETGLRFAPDRKAGCNCG